MHKAPSEETFKALGTDTMDPSLHGISGPIQTTFPEGQGPLDHAWHSAFETLGLAPQSDMRAGHSLGGYSLPKSMDRSAKRSYAASAYFCPNSGRTNLTVLTGAFVKKIEFETRTSPMTATGVCFSVSGKDNFVRATREVILSAGTVQSPQLLEVSGIGNKTSLDSIGIEVIIDNAGVGENLQVGSITM